MAMAQRAPSYKDVARSGIAACRAQLKKTEPRPDLTVVTNDDEDLTRPPERRDIDG